MKNCDNKAPKKSAKIRRPISDKAYRDFKNRLEVTLLSHLGNETAYMEAVNLLDSYIDGTAIDPIKCESSQEAMIAFHIIRPEIDKAMKRSSDARRRAMLRREATLTGIAETKPQDTPENKTITPKEDRMTADEAIYRTKQSGTSTLSRRQRRELDRQLSRNRRKKLNSHLQTFPTFR